MADESVQLTIEDAVAVVRLDDGKANALSSRPSGTPSAAPTERWSPTCARPSTGTWSI